MNIEADNTAKLMQKFNVTPSHGSSHLMPLARAAAAAGVSPKVFISASQAGDIPVAVLRIAGRKFVVAQALAAWLAAGASTPDTDLF
jgi:hypothetical protein